MITNSAKDSELTASGRRTVLGGMLTLAMGSFVGGAQASARPQTSAKPGPDSNMKHRSYSGRMAYSNEQVGNIGGETFTVTIQPNGFRTLRAMCGNAEKQILRDVIVSLDADWHPHSAFEMMITNQQFQGCSWYRFTDSVAECEGFTVLDGRFSQKFDLNHPVRGFDSHPIHSDTWAYALIRKERAMVEDPAKKPTTDFQVEEFITSATQDGTGGPRLEPLQRPALGKPPFVRVSYIGPERITVGAGTFDCEHFQYFVLGTKDSLDSWAYGDDCVPILETSSYRRARYELLELSGDPR